MALAGLSTLGVALYYATESTAGTKPATGWTELSRINGIGGLSISAEQIDASALTDMVSKYVAGRSNVDSSLSITVNLTPDTATEWETVISTYNALTGGKQMWFQVYHKDMDGDAFFIIAQPPQTIPLPETSQNSLWTVEIPLTVADYKGLDTAVLPTSSGD